MDSHNTVRPEDNVQIIEGWASIQGERVKCKYTWTMRHFNFEKKRHRTGSAASSPKFPNEPYAGLQWKLLVYPNGFDDTCENYISIMVEYLSDTVEVDNCIGNITLKILNFPSATVSINKYKYLPMEEKHAIGIEKFIKQTDLERAMIDDKIIISCEINTMEDCVRSWNDDTFLENDLGNDLKYLFENHDFSDVTLSVGKRKLKAHKAILAARSPVFKAMFHHDMKEKINNDVKITDISYDILNEMLRFIYTGRIQNFKMDLFAAADKYQLDGLKEICQYEDIKISNENAAETFTVAVLHRVDSLKTTALDYIQEHSKDVIATPGWKKMIKEYPSIVEEALSDISQSYSAPKETFKRRKLN